MPATMTLFYFISFFYAKTPLLQELALHAAHSSHHFLVGLHFQALEELMPIFVVSEFMRMKCLVGRKGKSDTDLNGHRCE